MRAPVPFAGRSLAFAGFLVIACIAAGALFAPWLAPADPLAIDPLARLSPPGAEHWFGTDHFGRDTLSRVIHGARMAVFIGIGVVLIALGGGIAFGVLMRAIDVMMAFPAHAARRSRPAPHCGAYPPDMGGDGRRQHICKC